jgi:hypothetical protein
MLKHSRTRNALSIISLTTGLALGIGALGQGALAERSDALGAEQALTDIPSAPAVTQVLEALSPLTAGALKQTGSPAERPTVPPLPDDLPNVVNPSPNGIIGLTPGPDDDIGFGHLRPQNLSSLDSADWVNSPLLNAKWLQGVALPIYVGPGAEHWGWLVNGWLIPNGYDPIAVGRDATFTMVQPRRGLYTFPVMEVREDGWFRFQYTPAGTAWSHLSQLDLGANSLTVESWSDWMAEVGRVNFRKHGASQPLRPEPTLSAPLQSLVGANSLIEPLDIQNDWMRVRVTQPANGCQPLPGSNTEEGWMRWRDDDGVPLIWFPADGC